MADAATTQSPPAADQAGAARSLLSRDRIARLVVVGSFLTIFLLVAALLVIASGTNPKASDVAEKTFNTILPVLAAWMGTVLAFYFSAQTQERTSNSLDRAISQAVGAPTSGVTVSQKMIPLVAIREAYDLGARSPTDIKLDELDKQFEKPGISRLIFYERGVFRYVLHVGTLHAFLVRAAKPASELTFADLMADADTLRQISKLVVFVPATATLADAKTALDAVPGAQDIIVTPTGNASETMLGWITNVDLIKALTAS